MGPREGLDALGPPLVGLCGPPREVGADGAPRLWKLLDACSGRLGLDGRLGLEGPERLSGALGARRALGALGAVRLSGADGAPRRSPLKEAALGGAPRNVGASGR